MGTKPLFTAPIIVAGFPLGLENGKAFSSWGNIGEF